MAPGVGSGSNGATMPDFVGNGAASSSRFDPDAVVDVTADSDEDVEVVELIGDSDDDMPVNTARAGVPPLRFHGYRRQRELGRGASGKVFLCTRKDSNVGYAVKAVDLRRMQMSSNAEREHTALCREVDILKTLPPHPNIVQMIDAFEETGWFMIVLELVGGGDLYTVLMSRAEPRFYEREAAFVLRQLSCGLEFLHGQGVIHRDLKLENVLIAAEVRARLMCLYTVKITDFGLSKAIGVGISEALSLVGTKPYTAPEVLAGGVYDFSSDLWGLGVVLYIMLMGRFPFNQVPQDQEETDALLDQVDSGEESRFILKGLLQLEPTRRTELRILRQHPWLRDELDRAPEPPRKKLRTLPDAGRPADSAIATKEPPPPQDEVAFIDEELRELEESNAVAANEQDMEFESIVSAARKDRTMLTKLAQEVKDELQNADPALQDETAGILESLANPVEEEDTDPFDASNDIEPMAEDEQTPAMPDTDRDRAFQEAFQQSEANDGTFGACQAEVDSLQGQTLRPTMVVPAPAPAAAAAAAVAGTATAATTAAAAPGAAAMAVPTSAAAASAASSSSPAAMMSPTTVPPPPAAAAAASGLGRVKTKKEEEDEEQDILLKQHHELHEQQRQSPTLVQPGHQPTKVPPRVLRSPQVVPQLMPIRPPTGAMALQTTDPITASCPPPPPRIALTPTVPSPPCTTAGGAMLPAGTSSCSTSAPAPAPPGAAVLKPAVMAIPARTIPPPPPPFASPITPPDLPAAGSFDDFVFGMPSPMPSPWASFPEVQSPLPLTSPSPTHGVDSSQEVPPTPFTSLGAFMGKGGSAPYDPLEVLPPSTKPDVMQVHLFVPEKMQEVLYNRSWPHLKQVAACIGCQIRTTKPSGNKLIILGNYIQCSVIQELLRARLSDEFRFEGKEVPTQAEVVVFVRAEAAGVVTGKRQFKLRQIKKESGAEIELKAETVRDQRPCLLSGTFLNILRAERHVFDLVRAVPIAAPQKIPDLPRTRISSAPLTGQVISTKGSVAWILARQQINHPQAKNHRGHIYVHEKDVMGQWPLRNGQQVQFHVYSDFLGLGAENVYKI